MIEIALLSLGVVAFVGLLDFYSRKIKNASRSITDTLCYDFPSIGDTIIVVYKDLSYQAKVIGVARKGIYVFSGRERYFSYKKIKGLTVVERAKQTKETDYTQPFVQDYSQYAEVKHTQHIIDGTVPLKVYETLEHDYKTRVTYLEAENEALKTKLKEKTIQVFDGTIPEGSRFLSRDEINVIKEEAQKQMERIYKKQILDLQTEISEFKAGIIHIERQQTLILADGTEIKT